ncbi:hypothetical protein AB0L66_34640 [Streptomyces sp. NPDC052207]
MSGSRNRGRHVMREPDEWCRCFGELAAVHELRNKMGVSDAQQGFCT